MRRAVTAIRLFLYVTIIYMSFPRRVPGIGIGPVWRGGCFQGSAKERAQA